MATFQYLDAITPVNKREFHWKVPEDVFIVEICQDSGLPRNHTCVNTTPLTVGGNIDLSTQCNIDHIRSGTRRNNNNNATNMADEEEEYYYPPLDENNNYTNENTNTENNNNIYTLPEEVIYDPTVGNIRS